MVLLLSICSENFYSNILGWLSVLVAGLAVAVTILIGWNIYSVIDLKKRLNRELKKYKTSIHRDLIEHKEIIDGSLNNVESKITQDIYLKTNLTLGTSLGAIGKAMVDITHIPSAMWFYLMGSRQLQNVDNDAFDHCFTQFKSCLDILVRMKDYEMDEEVKDSCLTTLREIDSDEINSLIILLSNISSTKKDVD